MLMFTQASAPAPHSSRRPIFTPDLSLLRSRLLPTPMIAPPRCPVLASTLRYPTAISEYAPATEAEAPDPGGAAQVSDVAPDPALPVEDGPALPLEDGPALGTQVHDRGPALATPGPGFGATQVHGPALDTPVEDAALDTQVSGRGPDLDTLMSGPALAAEDIILATQVSNAAPDPGLLVDHGAADGGEPPPVANIQTF